MNAYPTRACMLSLDAVAHGAPVRDRGAQPADRSAHGPATPADVLGRHAPHASARGPQRLLRLAPVPNGTARGRPAWADRSGGAIQCARTEP